MSKPVFGDPVLIRRMYEAEAAADAAEEARKLGLKHYHVTVTFEGIVSIDVDAPDIEAARQKAEDEAEISDVWDWDVNAYAAEVKPKTDDGSSLAAPDTRQIGLPAMGVIACTA